MTIQKYDLLEFTKFSFSSIVWKPKSRIEGLCECGLDSVDESHGVRGFYAVEGQSTCAVIQEHSYPGGHATYDINSDILVSINITSCEQTAITV